MTNPYEETQSDHTGFLLPDLNINVNSNLNTEQPEINDQLIDSSGDTEIAAAPPVQQEPIQIQTLNQDTREQRKQYWRARREAKRLPEGPEQDQALNDWAQTYHGISWAQYEQYQKNKQKSAFIYSGALGYKHGPDLTKAAGLGVLDSATDFANFGVKNSTINAIHKFRTGNDLKIPKVPKLENEGMQAFRDVSGIVIPFMVGNGYFQALGKGLSAQGVAAKSAPWLYRLGQNPWFQRFAKMGIDMGWGGVVDGVVEQNKYNDTLTGVLKQNKAFGWNWNFLPESLDTTGDDEETKQKKNVLEGMYLGFYTNLAEGLFRMFKAKGSKELIKNKLLTTSEYVGENGKPNKIIDEIVGKKYIDKSYDENPVLDELFRAAEIEDLEVKKLTEFLQDKTVTEPTLGIHRLPDKSTAGIISKSLDGILGASKDVTQLAKKGVPQGSLSNLLTNAARKAGATDEVIKARSIINSLKQDLVNAGKYQVKLPNGKTLKFEDIDREGTILAAVISDPSLSRGDLIKILDQFKTTVNGIPKLNLVGKNAVKKSTLNLLADWADINTHKATAYLLASEAAQIKDLSIAAGYMKDMPEVVTSINNQLIDRLKLFHIESSIADYNWRGRTSLLNDIKFNPSDVGEKINTLTDTYNQKLLEIGPKAEKFGQMLKDIQTHNPAFADAIRLAYEYSDGHIQSIKGINEYISESFGTISKLVYDGNQTIPSMWSKGLMTNIYTSMLSAISTPYNALKGNFGGFISEPLTVMYGALREGDGVALRRAAHQYFGFEDTFQQGLSYIGKRFLQASRNPDQVSDLVRKDLLPFQIQKKELNEALASAAEKNGDDGLRMILTWSEMLEGLGNNPILRSPVNAMTGLDGFTEITQKVAQDKGAAFDMLMKKYPDGNWTKQEFQEVFREVFKKNIDPVTGRVTDSAVEYARREIALNLDTPLANSLDNISKQFPILRTIFWFPRTRGNMLEMMGKWGPTSRFKWVHGHKFAGEYAELFGPLGLKNKWTYEEKLEILAKRGIDASGDVDAKFTHYRQKIKGRENIGSMAVMAAAILTMQGRLRGNGHWNRATQKVRDNQNWQRGTILGNDGRWHDIKALGPIGEWMSLVSTVVDNFNSISTSRMEEIGWKLGFIFSSSIISQSSYGEINTVYEILRGNDKYLTNYLSTTANAILPGSGFRSDLGNALVGGLREVEYTDIGEMMRNRNKWIDFFDRDGELPYLTDFITGKKVKFDEGSIWSRVKNHYSWFKSYPGQTPEGQFLIDIEFDVKPSFNTSSGGIEYSNNQKTELANLMGEDGYFRQRLLSIMRQAKNMSIVDPKTNRQIKGYVNIMDYYRNNIGYTSSQFEDYGNIKAQIEDALREAQRRVETQLEDYNDILQKEQNLKIKGIAETRGDMNTVNRILQLNSSN